MNREQRRRAQREGRPVPRPHEPSGCGPVPCPPVEEITVGTPDPTMDPRFVAALVLVERTGARSVQIRYSDDEQPVVWFIVALYVVDDRRLPTAGEGHEAWESASGPSPLVAAMRLCERLVDGGQCAHCGRPSGFHEDITAPTGTILDEALCWYQWDPELATFRRGCEAEVA